MSAYLPRCTYMWFYRSLIYNMIIYESLQQLFRGTIAGIRFTIADRYIVWDVESGGPKEPCITWGCTLAPPGEYDRTVQLRRRCGFMSNYFDHLLLLLLFLYILTTVVHALVWVGVSRECRVHPVRSNTDRHFVTVSTVCVLFLLHCCGAVSVIGFYGRPM